MATLKWEVLQEGSHRSLRIFLPEAVSQALLEQKIQVGTHEQPGQGVSAGSGIASIPHAGCGPPPNHPVAVNTLKNCTQHDKSSSFFLFRCTHWVLHRCPCPAGWDSISGSVVCWRGAVVACHYEAVQKGLCYDPFVLLCESDVCNCLSSRSLLVLIPFVSSEKAGGSAVNFIKPFLRS